MRSLYNENMGKYLLILFDVEVTVSVRPSRVTLACLFFLHFHYGQQTKKIHICL